MSKLKVYCWNNGTRIRVVAASNRKDAARLMDVRHQLIFVLGDGGRHKMAMDQPYVVFEGVVNNSQVTWTEWDSPVPSGDA